MVNRLILRQFVLGFLTSFMVLGLCLMAFLGVNKDILYAVGAIFSPAIFLSIRGITDSDESSELEVEE